MKISVKDSQQKNMDSMQGAEKDTGKLNIQKGTFQISLESDNSFVRSGVTCTNKFNLKIIMSNYLHRFVLFFVSIKSLINKSFLNNIYIQISYNT